MNTSPVITITFFRFAGLKNKFWAFTMMQRGHKYLKHISGLRFYRIMGSGRGLGFDWRADFSTYAFLGSWKDEAAANNFFSTAAFFSHYNKHAQEHFTTFMKPIKSHGNWDGETPFRPTDVMPGEMTGVITRATIKNRHLIQFWRHVPRALPARLKKAKDCFLRKVLVNGPLNIWLRLASGRIRHICRNTPTNLMVMLKLFGKPGKSTGLKRICLPASGHTNWMVPGKGNYFQSDHT